MTTVLMACSVWSPAQSQPPAASRETPSTSGGEDSLAAAARSAKAQKAHSKKIFTDEDMDALSGPLPRLKLEGPDNAEEVLEAIYTYKTTHTMEQTEQVIHDWYDRYDQMLVAAINQNRNLTTVRNVNASNTYDLCQENQDPGSCQYNQRTSGQSVRSDSAVMTKNSDLQQRVQQDMARISVGLFQSNLRYSWFKLRSWDGSETPAFPVIPRSR